MTHSDVIIRVQVTPRRIQNDSQPNFIAVKQKAFKTLNEVVTATMQLESYIVTSSGKYGVEDLDTTLHVSLVCTILRLHMFFSS